MSRHIIIEVPETGPFVVNVEGFSLREANDILFRSHEAVARELEENDTPIVVGF